MGGDFIRGRERIAEALKRSEKTVSRWIDDKIIKSAVKSGPYPNSTIIVRSSEIAKLRERFGVEDDVDEGGE